VLMLQYLNQVFWIRGCQSCWNNLNKNWLKICVFLMPAKSLTGQTEIKWYPRKPKGIFSSFSDSKNIGKLPTGKFWPCFSEKDRKRMYYLTSTSLMFLHLDSISSTFYARIIQKCCTQFFSSYLRFGEKSTFIRKILRVKCWWNWPLAVSFYGGSTNLCRHNNYNEDQLSWIDRCPELIIILELYYKLSLIDIDKWNESILKIGYQLLS